MPSTKRTASEINTLIDFKIMAMGSNAFGPNFGFAQLYSGPRRQVSSRVIGFSRNNRARAFDQAAAISIILEDTPIGKCAETFEGKGVYKYFLDQKHLSAIAQRRAADQVFTHISRQFVQSLWGEVSTAVCGASRNRVFYKHEIPTIAETIPMLIDHLVKSNDIDAVNAIPTADVRKTYTVDGPDAAFSLICNGELHLMHSKALRTGKLADFQEYIERAEFYMVERNLTAKRAKVAIDPIFEMAPTERAAWKQKQTRAFVIGDINTIKADLAKIDSSPVMPIPLFRSASSGARP